MMVLNHLVGSIPSHQVVGVANRSPLLRLCAKLLPPVRVRRRSISDLDDHLTILRTQKMPRRKDSRMASRTITLWSRIVLSPG